MKRWVSDSGDVYSNPATYLHYDGWNLLQEGSNAWGPSRVYVHGNRVDEIVWSYNTFTGEQAFHHYDARGHCTLLTGGTGNILEQYEYDAFGQPYFFNSTSQPINFSAFGNRFLFTGREWLSDLRIYDYRHRLYQPELGRFLQPDPKHFAAGDYNLYRYCHNDPINKTDPMGLTWVVDEKLRKQFDAARTYLSKDPGMKKTFDAIAASKTNVFVRPTNSLARGGTKTQLIQNTKTGEFSVRINWNPHAASAVKGGSQSPAMVLGHEASHRERQISDPSGTARDTVAPARGFGNREERRVIQGPEADAARTLGETQRFSGDARFFRVDDPTDR